ncbi:MAG: hypothetical protein QG596_1071, partial [Actinomycetota bacterium]|nr:hypothetical protein [Actinomycetota bacterium]
LIKAINDAADAAKSGNDSGNDQ